MATPINVLIVEDDESEQNSWRRLIERHNAIDNAPEIHPKFAVSLTEAEKIISNQVFEAAIVDIRLQQAAGQAGPNTDGNKVVELLLNQEMAVVALFTGESRLSEPPSFALGVKTFTKGEGNKAVLDWLLSHVEMIEQIRLAQSKIRQEMAKIFASSIWPRWSNWIRDSKKEDEPLQNAVTRHIVSHLHATLLNEMNQKAHPEEWYFVPPVRDGVRTGDIIRWGTGKIEVVITPRCDLERSAKNETIQLVECRDISTEWEPAAQKVTQARINLEKNEDPSKTEQFEKQLRSAESALGDYLQHKKSPLYHFLPRMSLAAGANPIGPFFVCFDKIRSVRRDCEADIEDLKSHRVATIASEFLPSLVERIGGYFSRIGTPDYSHPE